MYTVCYGTQSYGDTSVHDMPPAHGWQFDGDIAKSRLAIEAIAFGHASIAMYNTVITIHYENLDGGFI